MSTSAANIVRVRLFSYLREKLGLDLIEVELELETSVSDLIDQLEKRYAEIGKMRPYLRFAVNRKYCLDSHILSPDDEVAIISPVSGG